jgi:excisionase family DNA binding protein
LKYQWLGTLDHPSGVGHDRCETIAGFPKIQVFCVHVARPGFHPAMVCRAATTLARPRLRQMDDRLLTPREAAAHLRCSLKTLLGHVENGKLRYVEIGHGKQRRRRMFTDADLTAFIRSQTREDLPCQFSKTHVRRIGASTSNIVEGGFSARPRPRPGERPKP